jgi:Fe-S cluster assembly protein SufD
MSTVLQHDVLQPQRARAAERFAQLGWPTTRTEEWRYTNLAPLSKMEWKRAESADAADIAGASLCGRAIAELVFVNGVYSPEASSGGGEAGVTISTLRTAPAELVAASFGKVADAERHPLTALNTARVQDGAIIEVSDAVEGFVHLLFIGSSGYDAHIRNVILAARGSQIAVVESYVGTGAYFTNTVTEIIAADGAIVDHYKIGAESRDAFHIGSVYVQQERASSVTSRNVTVGGRLVRSDVNSRLDGEGATVTLDGLYIGNGTQHIDQHTVIEHAKPHCDSIELYKGVLDDNARGIFDGMIVVRPHASKTASKQENHNLLLSESAVADSKPTLEIHNDDVKCSHGSTIGQIAEEPMFYLRSRGIGEAEARGLLVHAFASEIVDRMKIEPVREQVRRAIFTAMPERMPERRSDARAAAEETN